MSTLNEIDASLQKLLIRNQKCYAEEDIDNDTDGGIIPMCLPFFAGDTKIAHKDEYEN